MMDTLFSACTFIIIVASATQINSLSCAVDEIERWGVKYCDACLVSHYNLTGEARLGCFCKNEYRRDSKGICVLEQQCPQTEECGINEKKRLFLRMSDSCFYKYSKSTEIETGCLCDDEFKRDESGRCIPKQECPKEKSVCKDNEIGRLGIKSSDDLNYVHKKSDGLSYGCFCRDEYVRDKNGICILKEEKVKCKPNEQFQLRKHLLYHRYCIENHARNPDGLCISDEECALITTIALLIPTSVTEPTPICKKETEERRCSCGCEANCAYLKVKCTPNTTCEDVCCCKEGYSRNINGVCVLKSDCPSEEVATTTNKPTTIPDPTITSTPTTKLHPIITSEPTTRLDSTITSNTSKPTTTLDPIITSKPTTKVDPTPTNKPTTKLDSTITSKPTTTLDPIIISKPTNKVDTTTTNKPTTKLDSTITSKPTTTLDPIITSKPTTKVDTTTTNKPATKLDPTITIKPITKLDPTITSKPTTALDSIITSKPTTKVDLTTTNKPTTTLDPIITSKPTTKVDPTTTIKPTAKLDSTITNKPTTKLDPIIISKPTTKIEPTSRITLTPTITTHLPTTSKPTTANKPITTSNPTTTTRYPTSKNKPSITTEPTTIKLKPLLISSEIDSSEDLSPLPYSQQSIENSDDCSGSSSSDCEEQIILPFIPEHKSHKSSTTTIKTITIETSDSEDSSSSEDHSNGDTSDELYLLTSTARSTPATETLEEDPNENVSISEDHSSEESWEDELIEPYLHGITSKFDESDPDEVDLLTSTARSTPATETLKEYSSISTDQSNPIFKDHSCEKCCGADRINADESDKCGKCRCEKVTLPTTYEKLQEISETSEDSDLEIDGKDCVIGKKNCGSEESSRSNSTDDEMLVKEKGDGEDYVGKEIEEGGKYPVNYLEELDSTEEENSVDANEESFGSDASHIEVVPPRLDVEKDNISVTVGEIKKPEVNTCRRSNEEYTCKYGCEVTCGSYGKPCRTISKTCKDGCFCVSGFARNSEGFCIPIAQCNATSTTSAMPQCSDPKEEYKCSYGCEQTCVTNESECVRLDKCKFSCVCIAGYVRGPESKCIPSKKCAKEKCLNPYEEYTCSYGCEAECATIGQLCHSKRMCRYGCVCIEGYARNSKNDCIPICECNNSTTTTVKPLECLGKYEESKLICEHPETEKVCDKNCKYICICKEGYERGSDGKCSNICTKPYEEYRCNNGCEPICPPSNTTCIENSSCINSCHCMKGYTRTSEGICIPVKDCILTTCPGPYVESKLVCETTCAENKEKCKAENNCKQACVCKEGFQKSPLGFCLPEINEEATEAASLCSKSEVLKCSYGCEPTCPKRTESCKQSAICKVGCICKNNYVRDSNGGCIHVNECVESKVCSEPNEEFSCSHGCEARCNSLHEKCFKNKHCTDGCYCKANYARNSTGACILKDNCKGECYDENHELKLVCEDCPAHDEKCRGQECKYICACIEGYIKMPDGSCVLSKPTHSVKCLKEHEELKFNFGCELTCSPYGIECIDKKRFGFNCVCEFDHIRDSKGSCISLEECHKLSTTTTTKSTERCSKPFETFGCSNGCEPTCPPSQKVCTKSEECKRGCICIDGYAKNSTGDCVKIEDCVQVTTTESSHATTLTESYMESKCSKVTEEYRCSYGCEATCHNYETVCRKRNTKCKKGCYCRHGFAKDSNGVCVPLWKCDSSMTTTTSITPSGVPELGLNCSRPNEHYQCGSHCSTTCENYNKICPIVNVVCNKGCYCNKGYARDSTKTCVLIKECIKRQNGICGDHEEYRLDTFVYNECITPPVYSITKTYGCYCIKGYKRNSSGKCIPVKKCPPINGITCTGDYEHYECGSACQTTCKNYNKTCPITKIQCINGCYCNIGYARNDEGVCIPVANCKKSSSDHCPNNEEYKLESPSKCLCIQVYSRTYLKRTLACHCIDGYKRDCAGHCVPKNDCPVSCKICGENEEYRYDVDTSPKKTRFNKYKVLKCHCIKGFRYDNTGKCVHDTGEICKINEVFSFDNYNNDACKADFVNPDNSVNVYKCHCKDGYKRNKSGVCIKEDDCPEDIFANCTRPNEHYDCGSPCQKTCGNHMQSCRIKCDKCINGCYCKKGYARDCTGTCISIKDCVLRENGICGNNEEYRLDSFINNECASNPSPLITEPLMHGCYCIKGYKRNCTGDCIAENKC